MVYSRNRLLKCINSLGTALQRRSRYLQLDTVISINTNSFFFHRDFVKPLSKLLNNFSRFLSRFIAFPDIENEIKVLRQQTRSTNAALQKHVIS